MFNQYFDTRSVVFKIIAINVLFFIASSLTGDRLTNLFGLHYIGNNDCTTQYGCFRPIQLITHLFMHGGLAHIFFNMFALYMFGNILERVWGPKRFLIFYFVTGFGAVFLHIIVQMIIVYNFTGTIFPSISQAMEYPGLAATFFSNTVGASGAVFGILVGFAMLFPDTEILIYFALPVKAKYFAIGYVLLELYQGFKANDDIAHFAHLGGALFGYILIKIWNRNRTTFY